jgi:GNAT superfamily N-acetyltransferase
MTPPGSQSGDIRIRMAESRDAEMLAAFNSAMAMETESKTLQPETIGAGVGAVFAEPDKGFYVIAEHAEEVVGALMITFEWSDWRNGFFWWIQSVYVSPDFRRRGVYARLHDFVVERAKEAGNVYGFRLYVERNNKVAQGVYASMDMYETDYLLFEQRLLT